MILETLKRGGGDSWLAFYQASNTLFTFHSLLLLRLPNQYVWRTTAGCRTQNNKHGGCLCWWGLLLRRDDTFYLRWSWETSWIQAAVSNNMTSCVTILQRAAEFLPLAEQTKPDVLLKSFSLTAVLSCMKKKIRFHVLQHKYSFLFLTISHWVMRPGWNLTQCQFGIR